MTVELRNIASMFLLFMLYEYQLRDTEVRHTSLKVLLTQEHASKTCRNVQENEKQNVL